MSKSRTLTNQDEIRRWAEERHAKPSCVRDTGHGGEDPGVIRLDFPGYSGDKLEEIEWEEWFRQFDENRLALLVQDETKDGERSNFNKLVHREQGESNSDS